MSAGALLPSFPRSVPPEFYDEISTLLVEFQKISERNGGLTVEAEEVFGFLPAALQQAPVYFCKVTDTWRYEFGLPYNRLPNGVVVFGTNQWSSVERLWQGLHAAKALLDKESFLSIAKNLGKQNKHKDFLVELAPLTRVRREVDVAYEVAGFGQGKRTIDWMFRHNQRTPILLEVKFRVSTLIEFLKQVAEGQTESELSSELPVNYKKLFLDVVEKFKPNSPTELLQGAWIEKNVKVNCEAVSQYFAGLDPQRLHFVIFNDGGAEAAILARRKEDKAYLLRFFNLTEVNRVFY